MADGDKIDEIKELERQIADQMASIESLPIDEQISVLTNVLGTLQWVVNNE